MQIRAFVTPAFLTVVLALATPASAIFVETPLRLSADDSEPANHQTVTFHAEAANDTARAEFAGKDVIVRWAVYDENASAQDDRLLRDDLVLDDQAALNFTWTLPAEADDRNVRVTIERDGELLGQVHLRVGDAEPMMMVMSDMAPESPAMSDRLEDTHESEPANVPGIGLVATLAGLIVVGVVARRRQ
jgi:hypothetical protein